MRILIAHILRVIAYSLSENDKRNLKGIFTGYISPRYLAKLDWQMVGSLVQDVISTVKTQKMDPSDVVDRYVDFLLGAGKENPIERSHEMLEDMKMGLVRQLRKQFPEFAEMSLEEASNAVQTGKFPKGEEKNRRKYQEVAAKMVGGRLYKYLGNVTKQIIREKSKLRSIEQDREKRREDIPFEEKEDTAIKTPSQQGLALIDQTSDISEGELEDLKKLRRSESLIKRVEDYIDRIGEARKKKIYKALLDDRLLAKKPKRFEEMAKDLGISKSTLADKEQALIKEMRKYLTGEGAIEKEEIKTNVKVPKYQTILKDKANSDAFKDFYRLGVRQLGRKPSELTQDIMLALAEGKTDKEVAEEIEGATTANVRKVRSRNFKQQYEKWYRAKFSKKASIADFIRRFAERIAACMI